ncbi:MAG: tetratricopeptide repeat protein [Flavobacteriales bacterium]
MADGTVITPLLVQSDDRPILGKDQFRKVIPRSYNAEIHYLVNSPSVRSSELVDDDIKGMKEFISAGVEKSYVWKNLSISAYASPEGEISLNANLADDRAKSASISIKSLLKRAKIEAANEEAFYKLEGKGEDWEGFKSAMEKSSIQDKDLILKVLKMYSDPDKRESEIKNMAATYTEIADQILPPLRRSQIALNAEEMSKSDAEITRLANTAPDSLTVEELLYAATLTNDLNGKLDIYKKCQKTYANDWRGANNAGYILLMQNKVNDAEAEFKKADKLSANNAIVQNNLGVCARWKGDRRKAREYYNAASGAGSDVSYNLGIIDIMDGDYASAVSSFGSQNTINSALAKLLNGDNEGAMSTLESAEDKDTAWGYYLKAVIAARMSNKDLVINSLKSAINKDGSLRDKAKRDLEFRNYKDDVAAL